MVQAALLLQETSARTLRYFRQKLPFLLPIAALSTVVAGAATPQLPRILPISDDFYPQMAWRLNEEGRVRGRSLTATA
jgi:hypothetical protein